MVRPGGEPNKQAPIQTHGGNCVTDTFLRAWRDGLNRSPNLLKGVSMIGINTGEVLVDGLRFSIAWLHGSRKESFPAVSSLQFWNFDLLHLKHRFHDSFRFFGILVVQHLNQHSWGDLPRKTEFVLEPAALRFLTAIRSEFLPKIIDFLLRLAVHYKRDRLIKFKGWTAVERSEFLAFDLEFNR